MELFKQALNQPCLAEVGRGGAGGWGGRLLAKLCSGTPLVILFAGKLATRCSNHPVLYPNDSKTH